MSSSKRIKRRRVKKVLIGIGLLIVLVIFLYRQNNCIEMTEIEIESQDIPEDFDGYKILQISDLHGKQFGEDQSIILEMIKEADPDIIVVTGDTIDSRRYNEAYAIDLLSQSTLVAPVYLVTGNHEARSHQFDGFQERLENVGVTVLRNESKVLTKLNSEVVLVGLDDSDFQIDNSLLITEEILEDTESRYTIALSHRPTFMEVYVEKEFDLIFSGHAHGGQIRLPFVGGILSPDQGFFPEYDSGCYTENNSTMVVSRGLGNSIAPQRLFNKPELILVILKSSL